MTAVVLCIGNRFRRDDGVAAAVADLARQALPVGPRVLESDGEPALLVGAWRDVDLAIVVDASRSALPAGAVRRIEVSLHRAGEDGVAAGLPGGCGTSSHGWALRDTVELGAALSRLPRRLVVYSVEGADFGDGIGLSAPVRGAVRDVVGRIACEMRGAAGAEPSAVPDGCADPSEVG